MKCLVCNNQNSDNAAFCNYCGAKTEQHDNTCPNPDCMRSRLPEEAVFCPDCGSELKQTHNSDTITSILSGLENNRQAQTQQVNSPKKEFSNPVKQKSKVTTENNTATAKSSTCSTLLDALFSFVDFIGNIGSFILGAIPFLLAIFFLIRGCS